MTSAPDTEALPTGTPAQEETTAEVSAVPSEGDGDSVSAANIKLHRETRSHLLSALKPYLSDSRRRAVDSMLQIADLLDVFKTVR